MKRNPNKKKQVFPKSRLRIHQWGVYGCLAVFIAILCYPILTSSNPQGGNVVAGSAVINQTSAGRLDIVQSSNKAVIDWRSFSIGNGEQTHFQQPSGSSVALNRVRGGQSSLINGLLTANGKILLINPNGVLFGKTSRVNVGSLFATTTDINNENFMAGRFVFDKPSDNLQASVTNLGRIEVNDGGAVVLSAPRVANEGLIKARLGHVVLAAGETFTLDFYGDGLLQFDLGGAVQGESADAPLSNLGTIMADGGIVEMTARSANALVERVINMEGIIQAQAVDVKGGTIILSGGDHGVVAVSGNLDVSGRENGQVGGEVKVLGHKVGLFEGAEIDASGNAGGGQVLVGGAFQGKGPEANARRTFVAETASIKADALDQGDGGEVIVWSDEITAFNGTISAMGGANGGDGGFVEVSGKQYLGFDGLVSVNAEQGGAGTVLLDPLDITIDTGDIDTGSSPDDGEIADSRILFNDGGIDEVGRLLSFFISSGAVEALTGDIIFQAQQNITINSLLNLSNQTIGESVVFQAGRNISVNASVITNGANLRFDADSADSTVGAADGIGTFSNNNVAIQTQGGDLTIEAAAIAGSSAELLTNGGDISVNSRTGEIPFNLFLFADASSDLSFGGDIDIRAQGNVILSGRPLNVDSSGSLGAGSVTITSTTGIVGIGNVDASSSAGTGGQIGITAAGDIFTGTLASNGLFGGGAISLISTTGSIATDFATEGPPFNPINSSSTNGAGGNISLTAPTGIEVGGIDARGSTGSGDIALTSDEINFLGEASLVQSLSALTLRPFSPTQAIAIGGSIDSGVATLDITTTDLAALADGFSSITIGRDDGKHAIRISDADFNDPVTIQTPGGGSILVSSFDDDTVGLRGQGNASVTLRGGLGEAAATTTLNADIVTSGQPIIIEDSVLVGASDVRLDTTAGEVGGALIAIERMTNSTPEEANSLTLNAGTGNVTLADVGVETPLGAVNIESANDVSFNGKFNAGDTRVNYVGNFTSVTDSLNVTSLFVDPEASSAEIFGSVAGAQGDFAATVVQGPVGDPAFTINGCVIGVSCFIVPPPPPPEPPLPTEAEPTTTIGKEIANASPTVEDFSVPVLSVSVRRRPSDNPTVHQYSNLGNGELWDNYSGGASVSDFAAFTNLSTSDTETKELPEQEEKVEE